MSNNKENESPNYKFAAFCTDRNCKGDCNYMSHTVPHQPQGDFEEPEHAMYRGQKEKILEKQSKSQAPSSESEKDTQESTQDGIQDKNGSTEASPVGEWEKEFDREWGDGRLSVIWPEMTSLDQAFLDQRPVIKHFIKKLLSHQAQEHAEMVKGIGDDMINAQTSISNEFNSALGQCAAKCAALASRILNSNTKQK